jgi:hypothetical protein
MALGCGGQGWRLWVFDSTAEYTLGIAEPPWHHEGADDFLPAATSRGEDATDPITPRPLPSVPRNGRAEIAVAYISALTGASPGQIYSATRGPRWRDHLRRNPGPCPLPVKITAMADGRPWAGGIDFNEAATLMKHLVAALFTVLSYLTGMRPGEVLGLRAGCCPDPESGRHLIHGLVFKTARDEDGNHLSQGQLREVPWVAIPPVVTAIRVLEQITADHDRVHEIIPADPHGSLGTARFRRTLSSTGTCAPR